MAYPNINWVMRSMPQYLIVYYFSNHKVIMNSDCIDRNNFNKYLKKYRFCIQSGTINILGCFQIYPPRNLNGKHPHQQNCYMGKCIFHFECLIRIHCNIISMLFHFNKYCNLKYMTCIVLDHYIDHLCTKQHIYQFTNQHNFYLNIHH